jgi:hypothetical protein
MTGLDAVLILKESACEDCYYSKPRGGQCPEDCTILEAYKTAVYHVTIGGRDKKSKEDRMNGDKDQPLPQVRD